jgi:hypothetical protein
LDFENLAQGGFSLARGNRYTQNLPVAVAVIASLRRALMLASAYLLLDFHFQQHLIDQLSAFAEKLGVIIQSNFW